MSDPCIRIYQHGDHIAIATIFCRAIHEIACKDYTPEQCLAWSDKTPNPEHWKKRCELMRPFVSVVGGKIAGFLELDPDGHIDCAFVNPDFQRRGVMTGLVDHAVRTAFDMKRQSVHVEASLTARPLFERLGFRIVRENLVTIGRLELQNFVMQIVRDETPNL